MLISEEDFCNCDIDSLEITVKNVQKRFMKEDKYEVMISIGPQSKMFLKK